MIDKIRVSLTKLMDFCISEGFKGYDPYDGLNSRLFNLIPGLSYSRSIRLAWIQLFKRSPINLRPLAGVSKEYNPKALGLFLSGYCNLYKLQPDPEYLDKMLFFTGLLDGFVNNDYPGDCWGYNFDWQAKAFFQPQHTPTVVATSFIANALLDTYAIMREKKYLDRARSACDFVLKSLNRTYDNNNNFAFSYSPLDKSVVFNASLLGSRLLSRVYSLTHEKELLVSARSSVAFCCSNQKDDGSWSYGTQHFHKWIDNFHTGYNLECLADYERYSGDNSFRESLNKGFDFYIRTFFTSKGLSKYYHNSTFPVDIHAPAQLIITLSKMGEFNKHRQLIDNVLDWTLNHMQSKGGYFYYQKNRLITSKIPYMRWAQAWMFYALSEYLMNSESEQEKSIKIIL